MTRTREHAVPCQSLAHPGCRTPAWRTDGLCDFHGAQEDASKEATR